jgi:hypothetical protein
MKDWNLKTDTAYLIGMLAVILLFLAPAWLQPDSIWITPNTTYSDLLNNDWSTWHLVAQTLREHGQVPLWRPSMMGGVPLVGNPLPAPLYPLRWLLVTMPLGVGFHVLLALHMWGAAFALYGLARRAGGCTPFAAFIGGLSYALSPKLIAEVGAGHVGLWQAYAWLPAVVWLVHTATEEPIHSLHALRRALGCGMVLAMAYLADPRIALLGALTAAAYALYRLNGIWRQSGGRAALHRALLLALVPLCVITIGAVQALPTLELMRTVTRATLSLQEAGYLSLPWRYLIGYLLADWGGYFEWMTYLGLLPLGLGLLGLWQSRARARWFWLSLAILALVYALGINTPLYPLLFRLLPALGWVRVPPRALILVAMASSVLAAYGTDVLLAGGKQDSAGGKQDSAGGKQDSAGGKQDSAGGTTHMQYRYVAALLSFGALLTFVGLAVGFRWYLSSSPDGTASPVKIPAALVLFTSVGALGSLTWFLSLRPRVPRLPVRFLLAATLLLDLGAIGHSVIELRHADEVRQQGLAVVSLLAAQTCPGGLSRVYSPTFSIPQHTAVAQGLEHLDGIDTSQLRWTTHFVALAGDCPAYGYSVTMPYLANGADPSDNCRQAVPNARLLGLLNVGSIVTEYPVQAPGLVLQGQTSNHYHYQNEHCMPRAFVMTRTESVSSWEEAQARLADGHDPAQSALVEDSQEHVLAGPPGWQPATVRDRTPNHLTVDAETTGPALLVLSEVWYPGWQATVNGIEQPILRVNGVLRGVYLDPGENTVVWHYRPASLRRGAVITLCAAIAWLLAALVTALAARTRREAAP